MRTTVKIREHSNERQRHHDHSGTYESQEELFFACASFLILLVFATADVIFRFTN